MTATEKKTEKPKGLPVWARQILSPANQEVGGIAWRKIVTYLTSLDGRVNTLRRDIADHTKRIGKEREIRKETDEQIIRYQDELVREQTALAIRVRDVDSENQILKQELAALHRRLLKLEEA